MKIHRFYIEQQNLPKEGSTSIPSAELSHQMNKVLRLRTGETVILFNGNGNEYVSTIVSYEGKEGVTVHVNEVRNNTATFNKQVSLFFSLIKKDNVEWIIQKGTELGVSHFIPVISARSEKKDINIERATKILIEAAEQCGRGDIPTLHPVMKLEDIFDAFDMPLIAFEKGNKAFTREEYADETSIGFLIGPEGGWTDEELKLFANKKAAFRSLGNTILRAETAAIAASALLLS